MTDQLLVATDVVAGYLPGVDILRGMSLDVGRGELVGIIGPNGAGKSTFVKAVFGLVEVRDGTVSSVVNFGAFENAGYRFLILNPT